MARPTQNWELTCVRGMEAGPIDVDKLPAPITDVRVERPAEFEANRKNRMKTLVPDAYGAMAVDYVKAVLANGHAPEPAVWECVAEKGVPVPNCPVVLVVKGSVYVGGQLGAGLEPEGGEGGEEGAEKEAPTKFEVLYSSSAGKVDGTGSYYSLDQLRRPLHSNPRILRIDLMKAKSPIGMDDRSTKDMHKIGCGSTVVFCCTEVVAQYSCINAVAFRWGRVIVVDPHRRELLVVEMEDGGKDKRFNGFPSRLLVPWEEVMEVGSTAPTLQATDTYPPRRRFRQGPEPVHLDPLPARPPHLHRRSPAALLRTVPLAVKHPNEARRLRHQMTCPAPRQSTTFASAEHHTAEGHLSFRWVCAESNTGVVLNSFIATKAENVPGAVAMGSINAVTMHLLNGPHGALHVSPSPLPEPTGEAPAAAAAEEGNGDAVEEGRVAVNDRRQKIHKVVKDDLLDCKAALPNGYKATPSSSRHRPFTDFLHKKPLLTPHLLGQGHMLTTDNLYSSAGLLNRLFVSQTFFLGTCRSTTGGIPKAFASQRKKSSPAMKMGRGASVTLAKRHSHVVLWIDNRPVTIITSVPEISSSDTSFAGRRVKGAKDGVEVNCPLPFIMYNTTMGGIDLSDQRCGTYRLRRSWRKWSQAALIRALDVAISNSISITQGAGEAALLQPPLPGEGGGGAAGRLRRHHPTNLFHLRQGNGHKFKNYRKVIDIDDHTPKHTEKSRKCWYCFRSVAKQCFACPSQPHLCTHCGKLWHHAELVKAASADPKFPMPRPLRREDLLPTQLAKMKFHDKWLGLKKTGLSSTAAYHRLKEEERREKAAEEDVTSDSPADPIGDAASLGNFGPAN